ncbi:HEPN domain-containing protein [bacterium]|nr:HEPN domain-containing protein [bacterium]
MEQFNDSGSKKDLMLYRMNTAKENLAEAKILLSEKLYKGANNRAYYAIFHTINAIFALDGKSYRRHKEVLGNFNKEYVKTDIFPKSLGSKIVEAEEIRHTSDYDDFYIATKKEAEELIDTAETFISLAEKYCASRL